jgi:predicted Zn-dependent protease with MMP-like domain
MNLSPEVFEELANRALESMPEEFREKLDNVNVFIQDYPTEHQVRVAGLRRGMTLFGLYEGIPLTKRDRGYNMVLPDRITIFRMPILSACRTPAQIRQTVVHTVMHEIAHHFGISDERLRDLGKY